MSEKNQDIIRQAANLVAVLATITMNGLANALPLNGQMTGAISDYFPVFFTPAGYVFSIWGLIYLGLIAFGIWQALPAQRANPRLRSLGYWFVLSCVANIVWLVLWHWNQYLLTQFAMLALLASLILIYDRLGTGQSAPASSQENWLLRLPFSIYLGWITVATIANTTILLYDLGFTGGSGTGPQIWTALVLVVAVGIATLMTLRRRDVAYLLVLVWAFAGIAAKHGGEAALVSGFSLAAAVAVLGLAAYSLLRPFKWSK